MLYEPSTIGWAVVRIYEYLSEHAVEPQRCPHSYKPDKPIHRMAVDKFVSNLPISAGFDFLWNYLTFQFYLYSNQVHQRRPLISWFVGKESWRRWKDFENGYSYYVSEWVRSLGLKNPVIEKKFVGLNSEFFDRERLEMSRRSGPNYCFIKVGEDAFTPGQGACIDCPFEEDCSILADYGKSDRNL